MAIQGIKSIIKCDAPNCHVWSEANGQNQDEIQANAKTHGWVFSQDKCYCLYCASSEMKRNMSSYIRMK